LIGPLFEPGVPPLPIGTLTELTAAAPRANKKNGGISSSALKIAGVSSNIIPVACFFYRVA